ncbi:hypothetical protein L207DRAFT_575890 [Hyaloscypha variabilis F]|uniref:Solute carrier family 40 member n=1 Tax=Hyaloscypha variabilis (strain UAMH 11265 / GT02V1 / F) TaxID=1149755 RepID=A0A2J6S8K2_HYAVF|nr:hypothetical protein L207DRAFT_575890 [Hyaloscypha variabilis F]
MPRALKNMQIKTTHLLHCFAAFILGSSMVPHVHQRRRRRSSQSCASSDADSTCADNDGNYASPSQSRNAITELGEPDEVPLMDELAVSSGEGGDEDSLPTRWQERKRWWKVYALYFVFMRTSNIYEYASVLLVALAFPNSLFATSIRGMASTIFTMLCASAVGSYIDRTPSRLSPLLSLITINHCAIAAAYACWLFWPLIAGETDDSSSKGPFSSPPKGFLFGFLVLLDVVQDLSVMGNRLSVERDWVSALVGPITDTESSYTLTQVNSVLKRIDLITKLVAPSLLPLIVSLLHSRAGWITLLGGLTFASWGFEVWCARTVAQENPQLRLSKPASNDPATLEDRDLDEQYKQLTPGPSTWAQKLYIVCYQDPLVRFYHYFSTDVWPASISVSLLQMTVLAYSATLITYLLAVGFSLTAITIARASGNVSALAGTFITPMAVGYLRKRNAREPRATDSEQDSEDDGGEARIVRTVGFWGIPVVLVLWNLSPATPSPDSSQHSLPIQLTLFSFLSLSLIGHWIYILMVQELEQVEIPTSQRSTFAGTEQSFASFFELCHWTATMLWNQPEDFRWLALGSIIVLGIGTMIFGVWRRGKGTMVRYEEIRMRDVGMELGG